MWGWDGVASLVPEECQLEVRAALASCACHWASFVPPVIPTRHAVALAFGGFIIGVFFGPLIDLVALFRGNVVRISHLRSRCPPRLEGDEGAGDSKSVYEGGAQSTTGPRLRRPAPQSP
jgi:hypothetical protein